VLLFAAVHESAWADGVEKSRPADERNFFRTADAFRASRRQGPERFSKNLRHCRSRPSGPWPVISKRCAPRNAALSAESNFGKCDLLGG
jgi:hypothetical protein